jgi:hypothetical protein
LNGNIKKDQVLHLRGLGGAPSPKAHKLAVLGLHVYLFFFFNDKGHVGYLTFFN